MNIDDEMIKDDLIIDEISSLAKDVVITFLDFVLKKNKNKNVKYNINDLKKHLDSYEISKTGPSGETIANCNNDSKTIKIRPRFMQRYYDDQLFDFVHEYFHAASSFMSTIELPAVIEEGMAEGLAEMALNYYFKKNKVALDHEFEQEDGSYKACAELIKMLLAILEKDGKDHEFIYKYYFCNKEEFYKYFIETFGLESKEFLVRLSYIDPLNIKNSEDFIRKEIDRALTEKLKFKLNPDEIVEKSSKKGQSNYYYHNLLMERYAFRELSNKHMKVLTFENFIELLKRVKPITRSSHFNSPELDSLLSVFYFPNMNEFSEVLTYVKKLPQMIGVDLLSKTLPHSENKMETILKYSEIIRDFEKISSSYLKYYSKNGDKKTKFKFLLKTLSIDEKHDSYYYYELLKNSNDFLTDTEKANIIALVLNFIENNSFETDQEYTLKVIAILPDFANKKCPYISRRVKQLYKLIQVEMMTIIKTKNIHVRSMDTEKLELKLVEDMDSFNSIYELAYSNEIIYFKKYLVSILDRMMKNNKEEKRKS